MIHYKNSKGFEWWREYDLNGNEVYYSDTDGQTQFKRWLTVDENGEEIFIIEKFDGEKWTTQRLNAVDRGNE